MLKHHSTKPNSAECPYINPLRPIILGTSIFLFAFLSATFISQEFIPKNSASADASVDIKVTVPETLSITSSKPSIELNPEANSTLVSDSTDISVSTSNKTGYTLTVSSTTEQTSLTDSSSSIPTLTAETALADFPVNYWGYSVDSTSYLGLPPLSTPATIKTTDTTASNDTTTVSVGTKIDMNTPAGIYKNTVIFTATPNYVPKTLNSISTMQEMTSDICTASTVGESNTLTDERDNKTYTVKKLEDNKCWMTQNLALTGSRTLTSSDSDVTSNFSLPAVNTGTWCQTNDATCHNQALHRLSDQSGSTGTSYGGYYNWYAATAGTGTYEKSSGNATSSICPKGWRLPTGGSGGEFQALYTAIGSTPSNITAGTNGYPGFVFSGFYYGSSFYYVGTDGYYWSSTARNNNYAYYLNFNSSNVYPQNLDYKYYGNSVRCVAK